MPNPPQLAEASDTLPTGETLWAGAGKSGNSWRIYNGDAQATLSLMKPLESVDCVITSPPYYSQRDYGVSGQIGLETSIAEYVEKVVQALDGTRPLLKPDGTLFVNLGDTYYSAKGLPKGNDRKHRARRFGLRPVDASGLGVPRKTLIGIPWRIALQLVAKGWVLRSSIIWHRPDSIPEPTAHDRPWRTYENVFLFSKSPRYYFSRAALGDEEDIWKLSSRPRKEDRLHTAPFPDALVERCIDVGCRPAGTVLDPFMGSGTTIRVAVAKSRNAVGIELNKSFCEHAAKRLTNEV
jgi:DNA modification methylase